MGSHHMLTENLVLFPDVYFISDSAHTHESNPDIQHVNTAHGFSSTHPASPVNQVVQLGDHILALAAGCRRRFGCSHRRAFLSSWHHAAAAGGGNEREQSFTMRISLNVSVTTESLS